MASDVLTLTLHRRWFDAIASGEKTVEYREIKPYWTKRLEGRFFRFVKFRNGYQPHSPTIIMAVVRVTKTALAYEIHLAKAHQV